MIIAFAGRRSPGLADEQVALVAERIEELLTQTAPTAVVGAAACGADLLVLEAALALHARNGRPEIHVVLPTAEDAFREDSVDPPWRDRFDAALAELRRRGMAPVVDAVAGADDPYAAGNHVILDTAQALAGPGEQALVLMIAGEGEGVYSTQLVDEARLRGMRVMRINPARPQI